MGDLPGVMVAAFAVAIFASGILIGLLWRFDHHLDELDDAFEDGRAIGRTESRPHHVRCVPRPFDHAEDGL